ncbi:MAG: hypothetical protein KXJ49_05935 [Vulcanococcus sp.]|uniref:DUF6339 family protein n=1 Tax=Vulcanococcus sp. TaxID=2856995 RepID=UPI0025DA0269|nr:DUF6339 family protein [Vulcanococcus sp.]MBW0167019.1 hypothetical protein [Vulcanococcus sp.]
MYYIIPSESVESAFSSLIADPGSFRVEDHSAPAASEIEIDNIIVIKLKSEITRLYDGIEISTVRSDDWNEIDGATAALLHNRLSHITPKIAVLPNFWIFLSLYMREIVYRRYCYESWDDLKSVHFGTQIYDSLFPRLWHRASLSIDQRCDDPYWLTRRGGSDYWSSFVLRAIYSQSPQLIRALTRYFYDPENTQFRTETLTSKSEIIRILGPELRKQHSVTPFEILTEDDCDAVIHALAGSLGITRVEGGAQ